MEPGGVDARLGSEGSESGDEIQWFEDHLGRAIAPRRFERVSNLAVAHSTTGETDATI